MWNSLRVFSHGFACACGSTLWKRPPLFSLSGCRTCQVRTSLGVCAERALTCRAGTVPSRVHATFTVASTPLSMAVAHNACAFAVPPTVPAQHRCPLGRPTLPAACCRTWALWRLQREAVLPESVAVRGPGWYRDAGPGRPQRRRVHVAAQCPTRCGPSGRARWSAWTLRGRRGAMPVLGLLQLGACGPEAPTYRVAHSARTLTAPARRRSACKCPLSTASARLALPPHVPAGQEVRAFQQLQVRSSPNNFQYGFAQQL